MYRDLLESDDRSFTGFNLDNGYVITGAVTVFLSM